MTRGREFLLVVLAAVLVTTALTYPLAFRLGHIGRVDNSDGQFSIWNVAWVARTLVADPLHVFDSNIFYPHRDTLAYSESNLGAGAIAAPVYWATRNPYAAHNAAVAAAFVLSFIGMFYLVRHLTGDRRAAAIAAIAFAFCPFEYARTAHVQLLMIGGLPFVMLAFHRLTERPTPARGAVLGLAMAAQALFCGYYGIFALMTVAFAVLVVSIVRRLWTLRRFWLALAAGALVAIALAVPAFVPYLRLQHAGFRRPLEAAASFSATWSGYLTSSSYAHAWLLTYLPRPSESLFPGVIVTTFGLAGAWVARRRQAELVWLYGGLAVLALWASFGPRGGLYSVLYHVVPFFSWMRAPGRFGLLVTFALSVLGGVALAALFARVKYASAVAALLGAATAAELATPWPMPAVEPLEPVYRVLRELPPGPVIEMPFWYIDFMYPRHTYYMLQSTSHWMPLVNGYSDYMPPDFLDHVMTLAAFPSVPSLHLLAPEHVRYAIFHRYWYSDATWATVTPRMKELAPYLRQVFADEGTELYEIVGAPP